MFFRAVSSGMWNKDRVFWRFFSPIVSIAFALVIGAIFSDNIMSVDSFGLSAPAKDVVNSFGFNKENVADRIIDILKK